MKKYIALAGCIFLFACSQIQHHDTTRENQCRRQMEIFKELYMVWEENCSEPQLTAFANAMFSSENPQMVGGLLEEVQHPNASARCTLIKANKDTSILDERTRRALADFQGNMHFSRCNAH